MLSKRVSSIGLFTVSDMTGKPTAKYVKFWFRITLLINFGRSRVIVSVARNLAVLQHALCNFFGFSVISVKKNVSTEI